MKIILIVFSIVFLSGCTLLEQKRVETAIIKKPTNGEMNLGSFPTQLRAVYYNKDGISCAEPVPDVAVSENINLKLLDSKGLESKTGIIKLDGRDSTVLITRELLFRICEMGLNYEDKGKNNDTEGERTEELYREVLQVVKAIATGEVPKAEAKKANAEAKKVQAEAKMVIAETNKIAISAIKTLSEKPNLDASDTKVLIQKLNDFEIK